MQSGQQAGLRIGVTNEGDKMAKRMTGINLLTYTEVSAAKSKNKDFSLSDGGGLLLYIKSSGSKTWRYRYCHPITKKRQTLTIGKFPKITLADAREIRNEAARMVELGVDPIEERNKKNATLLYERELTFEAVYNKWFELKKTQKLSKHTYYGMWKRYLRHLKPLFGKIPIKEITPRIAISAFQKLVTEGKHATLRLCVIELNGAMNYAVNSGLLEANPLIKIVLALPKPTSKNYPALRPEELPELMSIVKSCNAELSTKLVFEWQLLTMTRPNEAAGTRWDEIDIENKIWKIPAERMKGRKEHVVPLSRQALEILKIIMPFRRGVYVFYSSRNKDRPITTNTVGSFMFRCKELRGRMVSHGTRALASTTLNELGFSPDVIEAALAHKSGDIIRDTYNRSNYFEQRKIMMSHWGDLVEKAKNGEAIIMDGNRGVRAVGM